MVSRESYPQPKIRSSLRIIDESQFMDADCEIHEPMMIAVADGAPPVGAGGSPQLVWHCADASQKLNKNT